MPGLFDRHYFGAAATRLSGQKIPGQSCRHNVILAPDKMELGNICHSGGLL
jgi:hypothetical protein